MERVMACLVMAHIVGLYSYGLGVLRRPAWKKNKVWCGNMTSLWSPTRSLFSAGMAVMTYVLMAYIVMTYVVLAYMVMAYVGMVYICLWHL